jgi:hypothetical protein
MNTNYIVTAENELVEVPQQGRPAWLRWTATFISYIFHPVFIPLYVVVLLLFVEPFLFAGFSLPEKLRVFIQALQMYMFYPLVTVLLLKALNFIRSVKLQTQKERTIPFIACGIWYFWLWNVWHNLPQIPHEMVVFAMSVFLASVIGLLFNIYIKISMHGLALSTSIAFLFLLAFTQDINFFIYLSIALLIVGIVCTARLLLGDHAAKEVYLGLAAGVFAVIIANFVQ